MDDYLDQYFSSSSWSDVNVKERSSWIHSEADEPNTLLPATSLGVYHQDDKNNAPISNLALEWLAQSTPDLVPSGESGCGVEKGLLSRENGPQTDGDQNCSGNSIKDQMLNGNSAFGNMEALQFNTSVSDMMTTPSLSFNERGNVMCAEGESSEFQRSFTSLETLSPIPQLWHPQPYEGLSSLPVLMEQSRMQSSCLQEENGMADSSLPVLMEQSRMQSSCLQEENGMADDDSHINRFIEIDKILQPENLSASINAKGKQDTQSSLYSSLPGEPRTTKTMSGLPSLLQAASTTPNNGCNGIGKPRVRARRGQATDPHSIAERIRREKIAERMKNLQQLVPNSNKTDKASMLDEIIEYVKFLQLQVKVLSMSRLGAAGAVVPLITDNQAEGSNGLSLSPLAGQGIDFSPSPDQVVFEQEVVKLMESNVTSAMQYLQTKGLCLMPIALAAAISNGKASSSSSTSSAKRSASEERKKFGFTKSVVNNDVAFLSTCSSNSIVQNSNCSKISSSSSSNGSLPVGTQRISPDGKFMIGKLGGGVIANSCNGSFKQDVNTLCTAK